MEPLCSFFAEKIALLSEQTCLLLRCAVVVLENSLRGGHSAKVRDTARMPPEGYEVIFCTPGGVTAIVSVA